MHWKEKNIIVKFEGVDAIGNEDGRYCYVPVTHKATLGEIVDLLYKFQ